MRSALLLAAFIGPAVAQMPTSESTSLAGPLAVFLKTDNAAPPQVLNAMKLEVEAITASMGIRVHWSSPQDSEVYSRIAVVTLRGKCSPEAPISSLISFDPADPESLGQTHVADGKVLPFADIRCDAVRKVIERDLRATSSADREELLGHALGRVMAHELYHVLLRTRSHGHNGLTRPVLTNSDLVARLSPAIDESEFFAATSR